MPPGNKVYPSIRRHEPADAGQHPGGCRQGHAGRQDGYCPNGDPRAAAALAAEVSGSHGMRLSAENVAIQPGGKPVIEKFLLSLVNL